MKKLFAILAIAGTLAACNNGGDDKTVSVDSPKTTVTDAVNTADTANKMIDAAKDSADKMMNKVGDTANKMVDKVADKMKEAANKMVEKVKEKAKQ